MFNNFVDHCILQKPKLTTILAFPNTPKHSWPWPAPHPRIIHIYPEGDDDLYRYDLAGLQWSLSSLEQQNPPKNDRNSEGLIHIISLVVTVQTFSYRKCKAFVPFKLRDMGVFLLTSQCG